ncbi:MAG: potassium channel family protein [Candidatus Hodarchaeota archaeon]
MKPLKKRLIAQWRDFKAVVLQFKWTLFFFLALSSTGALILWIWYDKKDLGLSEAFYTSIRMIFFDINLDYPNNFFLQVWFILVPIVGVIIVVDGLLRFVNTLFAKASRLELWQTIKADTYSDHVIVCGLGHLGYRVSCLLTELGEEVIVIAKEPESLFIDELRGEGIPVFIEESIRESALQKANISKAKSIIIVEKDDLTNIGIVLKAKELKPDIQIVLELFDEKLAEWFRKSFDIYRVFLPAILAAPSVAAAIAFKNITIRDSIYFGGITAFLANFTLTKNSKLIGLKLKDLENMEMTIVVLKRGKEAKMEFHPDLETEIKEEDFIICIAPINVLKKIERLNHPKQKTIHSSSFNTP